MNTIQSILVLAYPNAGEQDLLIPWELLKAVAWDMAGRGHPIEVVLGSFEGSSEGGTVPTQMGMRCNEEACHTPSIV